MQATALGSALEGVQGGIPSEVKHRVSARTSQMSVWNQTRDQNRKNTGKIRGNFFKETGGNIFYYMRQLTINPQVCHQFGLMIRNWINESSYTVRSEILAPFIVSRDLIPRAVGLGG